MQNTPYQHMAKEFLDLWQKQVSAVVSDKQFIQSMLEMFQNIQKPGSNERACNPDTANPANAPDANHGMLAELAFRLAMCEKRIATLEQELKKSRSKGNTVKSAGNSAGRGSKQPRK